VEPSKLQDSGGEESVTELTERAIGRRRRLTIRGSGRTVLGVYVFLVILLLASRAISPAFGSISFARTVIALSAFTAVVAFGQFIVVLTGGIDLSIPNIMALVGVMLTGLSLGQDGRVWWVLPTVLVVGSLIGMVNGLGVVYLSLSPVVMTLAVNVVLSGVILVYTAGTPKGGTPQLVINAIQGRAFGGTIPNTIILVVFFLIVGSLLMNLTVFGRRVYAIGSNRQVAFLSGVRVGPMLIAVYTLSGLSSAIGGVMLAGYGNTAYLGMGDPYLLLSLAAVVVGGCHILGGRGLYLGVVGGAIILTAIETTLSGTSLPQAVRQIIFAIVIIIAVLVARQES
jgi:ribose transport system permease protein